jgi:hypothetical protein
MAYFTDNTFPIFLRSNSYSMFQAPIHFLPGIVGKTDEIEKEEEVLKPVTMKHYKPAAEIMAFPSNTLEHFRHTYSFYRIPGVPVIPKKKGLQGGFMFWSVVISPPREDNQGAAIVWDSARYLVQGRDLNNISQIVWQIGNIRQGDCITVIPDRHYIYMTDYGSAPTKNTDWLAATGKDPRFVNNTKYFIVADSRTGEIRVNVSLKEATGVNPSLLVPGKNNDVFIGVPSGVARLYV